MLESKSAASRTKSSAVQLEKKGLLPDAVASLFLSVMPQAMKIFREEIRKNQTGAVSIPQFRILALLWRDGASSNKDLAEAIGVSGAAMSRMIDHLVEQEFVKRMQGEVDRRLISIDLTKAGLSHFLKARNGAMHSLAKRMSVLQFENLQQIGFGLEILTKGLRALHESTNPSSSTVFKVDSSL